MQGPLRKDQWGRIWAKAFVNGGFKDTLEKSPHDAAEIFMGDEVKPLIDTHDMNGWSRFFFNTLNTNFTQDKREKIRGGLFNQIDQAKMDDLRAKLKGNQFFLWKNGAPLCQLPPQDIDGLQEPSLPLTRDEWVRVYARAFLEDGFRGQLENNPAQAVAGFHELGRQPNARIFKFPTLDELNAVLPAGDPLKNNRAKLIEILQKIADGMPAEGYETALEATLTC